MKYSKIYGDVAKYPTVCCALATLSLNNNHDLEEIKLTIETMKKESNEPLTSQEYVTQGMKEKAVFVITLPNETTLVENLIKLGFKNIAEFHRRICYPQDEMLTMWFLSWE